MLSPSQNVFIFSWRHLPGKTVKILCFISSGTFSGVGNFNYGSEITGADPPLCLLFIHFQPYFLSGRSIGDGIVEENRDNLLQSLPVGKKRQERFLWKLQYEGLYFFPAKQEEAS